MKKVLKLLIMFVIVGLITIPVVYATSDYNVHIADELIAQEQQIVDRQAIIHIFAETARTQGYSEDCEIIIEAQKEWQELEAQKTKLVIVTSSWTNKFQEYPVATYIWLYLTEQLNYNEYIAAGIMGNLMAEVGGGTLNIQYQLYGGGGNFYGFCQWSRLYCPDVQGINLIEQCNYLANTIKTEMDNFGSCYARGYQYNNFLELTNIRDAALMFAKTYERCTSASYYSRQNWAENAYNYFTTENNAGNYVIQFPAFCYKERYGCSRRERLAQPQS